MTARPLNSREILEAFTLLESFTSAGVLLKEALLFAGDLAHRPALREFFAALRAGILKGRPMSKFLAETQPRVPAVVTGMLAVAERTGETARLFTKIQSYLAENGELAQKVRGALIYPAMIGAILVLGLAGLWIFVLPAFAGFARQMGGAAGRELLALSGNLGAVLGGGLGLLSLTGLGTAAALAVRKRNEGWARTLDAWFYRLPGVGLWAKTLAVHQFASALEVLLAGGVPLPEALEEARAVVPNRDFARRCDQLRRKVVGGSSLSAALKHAGLFPGPLVQWVAVGEKTGRHDEVFAQIRRFTARDLDRWTTRFTQLLEPSMTVVMGLVMILFIVGFILPLLNVYGNLL